jgi:glutaredoxin
MFFENKKKSDDKILNPKTNRYVLKTGKIGQSLLNNDVNKQKKCGPNKIMNPTTNRCVLKTSKVGKQLLNGNKQNSFTGFKNKGWFIFSNSDCGYCQDVKDLLTSKNIKYKEQQITKENIFDIYDAIDEYTNKYRYTPIIFHNGKFIGGYIDLKKYLKQ